MNFRLKNRDKKTIVSNKLIVKNLGFNKKNTILKYCANPSKVLINNTHKFLLKRTILNTVYKFFLSYERYKHTISTCRCVTLI